MQPILEVQNIGKKFKIQHQKEAYLSLRESIAGVFKKTKTEEDFWALKDVSFNVYPGESIGIIGRNGAGKSTLLKILSKITPPSTGKIISRGRIASLLEVGTGFHMELTGRENIYLNGSILGLKRIEITKQFDAIADFSGVDKFLDTPLKHYSSGMQLRLAFAVAAHLEPELLIIDEVLAVGDAEFQKKCMGKMSEVSKSGRTILFVSHNMGQIESLCSKAFVLKNGISGPLVNADSAIKEYLSAGAHTSAISNQTLTDLITIEQFQLHAPFIHVDERIQLKLHLAFSKQPDLRGLSVLLYNAAGIRIGIIDLRDSIRAGLNTYSIALSIKHIPLIPGIYSFGLFLDTAYGSYNFYDLISLDILEKEEPDLLKYPSNVRGIIDINYEVLKDE